MQDTTRSTIERTMNTKVLPALPVEFQRARVFWSGVAGRVEFWVEVDSGCGWQRIELPSNVSWFVKSELSRMRAREGTDEKGLWISLLVELAPEQSPVFHENFETRIYWGSHDGAPFAPPTDGEIVPDDAMYQHFFATCTPEKNSTLGTHRSAGAVTAGPLVRCPARRRQASGMGFRASRRILRRTTRGHGDARCGACTHRNY